MTDSDVQKDVGFIILKCAGLGFPVSHVRTERGPRVTTHYFKQQLGANAPLSKVINRSEDISFACGVDTCMITRERNEIAFAIPLQNPELIKFDSALQWLATNVLKSPVDVAIPLLMGQTTTGQWFTIDLANQPHMLMAGTTGGGKSVFLAEILCGIAVTKKESEIDIYLVDTKQLDLPLFQALPHVKAVMTKITQVHQVLDSLIKLVRSRTDQMTGLARNIREWNAITEYQDQMKYKLLVIDELADVMDLDVSTFGTGKKRDGRETIEQKLKTLTQISRAAGIHVIAATQRPSVEVISGDIKANFPMRLSFKLPTSADSRVILGEGGAQNLLGKGDYLYQLFENPDIKRGHGAFVRTEDIARVVTHYKKIREAMEMMVEQETL
ncbi:MAG TPA: FtsK/SpoIIIE domain-containing protein [Candidatus Saccharimonadales bacterium]|jgi:S-DNA-T family DNA segregation ATPase FtsK/SpoIIIE